MKFKEYNQKQGLFRTIVPAELLEEAHPARIVSIVVEHLKLEKLYDEYSEEGCPGYHPKMLLKVLFYSYMNGLMSCRGMWNSLKYRADYIFLSGDQVPDFRTINRFRTRVKDQLSDLFAQIVFLCVELDLVDFQYLAIDGQKIKANANYRKTKDKKRYQRAVERVSKGMEKLLSTEPTDDITEEQIQKKLAVLKKQEKKLSKFKQIVEEMNESDSVNLSDKEAKSMSHKDGRTLPSYNHQSAADGKHGITVAVQTTTDVFDHGDHLLPLVDQSEENGGKKFKTVMADCGFCDFKRLIEVKDREEDFYLPDRNLKKKNKESNLFPQDAFQQDGYGNWVCPAGEPMKEKGFITRKDGITVRLYIGTSCIECEIKSKCTKGKSRQIGIDSRYEYRTEMRAKLNSDKGRAIYSKRQAIIEAPHGHDQKNLGWIQHHLRGLEKASLEFMLLRIGSNIGKIFRYASKGILAYSS